MNIHRPIVVLSLAVLLGILLPRESSAEEEAGSVLSLQQLENALDLPCVEIDLVGEINLKDVLDIIEAAMSDGSGLPIQFVYDSLAFAREGVEGPESFELNDFYIKKDTHTYWEVLQVLRRKIEDPEICVIPQNGHFLVSSYENESSDEFLFTRVYDISPVLAATKLPLRSRQSGYSVDDSFSQSSVAETPGITRLEMLIELLQQQSSPPAQWVDIDGEGGSISLMGNRLVIRQTYRVHREINEILKSLVGPLVIQPPAPKLAAASTRKTVHDPLYAILVFSFALAGWIAAACLTAYIVHSQSRHKSPTD